MPPGLKTWLQSQLPATLTRVNIIHQETIEPHPPQQMVQVSPSPCGHWAPHLLGQPAFQMVAWLYAFSCLDVGFQNHSFCGDL